MQIREDSRRLGNQHWAKEAVGWAEMGPGRLAQPITKPSRPPIDLAAIWTICRTEARSHASTHSSSAAEDREEKDAISERRGSS
jgi:hypothetical protein